MKVIKICMFLIYSMSYANKFDELYHQAAQLYVEKDYQKAANIYASLEPQSAIILYNRAICLYQTQSYLDTLLLLKKASLSANYALQKKIIVVLQATLQKLNQAVLPFWYTILLLLVACCSVFFFQMLFFCTWFCLLFISQKYVRWSAMILFIISCGVLSCSYYICSIKRALVIHETPLFIGPDKNYNHLAMIPVGQEVRVVQAHDSWYKIVSTHATGWVAESDIALL